MPLLSYSSSAQSRPCRTPFPVPRHHPVISAMRRVLPDPGENVSNEMRVSPSSIRPTRKAVTAMPAPHATTEAMVEWMKLRCLKDRMKKSPRGKCCGSGVCGTLVDLHVHRPSLSKIITSAPPSPPKKKIYMLFVVLY